MVLQFRRIGNVPEKIDFVRRSLSVDNKCPTISEDIVGQEGFGGRIPGVQSPPTTKIYFKGIDRIRPISFLFHEDRGVLPMETINN
jgi:hypothetical protein